MNKKKGSKKAKNAQNTATNKKRVVKRGKSKLTLIRDSSDPKDSMEAFRCDANLKKFLAMLPKGEKSSFIVDAIYKAIAETREIKCPTCGGIGKIGPNVKVIEE